MTCHPCTYQITPFSFTSEKKVKSIEERKEAFRKKLKKVMDNIDPKCTTYPAWLRSEFWEYWTALDNDFGRKMKFEKEKSWNTKLRLLTWKRNSSKDPRWNQVKPVYRSPETKNEYPIVDYSKFQADEKIGTLKTAGDRLRRKWS